MKGKTDIGRERKQETEKYAWEMEKGRILTDQTEKCESKRQSGQEQERGQVKTARKTDI